MGKREWLYIAEKEIKEWFPNLKFTSWEITSEKSREYNCIAWAAGDANRNWWPDNDPFSNYFSYWPDNVPREETLDAFIEAYKTIGYFPCDNDNYEPGFEKIAIYAGERGVPTHAARQISDNLWTSKLGDYYDIQHATDALNGKLYGKITQFMKRRIK